MQTLRLVLEASRVSSLGARIADCPACLGAMQNERREVKAVSEMDDRGKKLIQRLHCYSRFMPVAVKIWDIHFLDSIMLWDS